ncbi:hypothetical protein HY643_00500 [Candidatus Woesearchaeota archaeon]|nr:hypothetical protein [Candidatus Woesearchaeota archaeon]
MPNKINRIKRWKNILNNKKGTELSLNFLIIAALALIALIVIALFFLGGMEKIFGEQKDVKELTKETKALAKASCEFKCRLKDRVGYDNPSFPKEMTDAGYSRCSDLEDLGTFDEQCVKHGCTGTAVICADMGQNCAKQSGCSLSGNNCAGTATQCSVLNSATTCSAQTGCSWQE